MYESFRFDSAVDKKSIAAYSWTAVEKPIGVVQILHGMGEHATRYDDFANYLNGKGYLVFAEDHRGHGATAGDMAEYGYIGKNGFSMTVEDAKTLSDIVKQKYPGLPLIILGHSYGSFLAQEYVIRYAKSIDGVIFSGSAAMHSRVMTLRAGMILSEIIAIFRGDRTKSKFIDNLAFGSYSKNLVNPLTKYDWLTTDKAIVDMYVSDEYCGGIFPLNFYVYFFGGLIKIANKNRVAKIRSDLPIMIASGVDDPVGGYGKFATELQKWYTDAGITDITFKLYPGMRHEIINETDRAKVYTDLAEWLDEHLR
jgi:alpha-beta hydrolase superfamily lysophospholipase